MRTRGFSLLEVVIALYLLAATVAAVCATIPQIYRQTVQSKNRYLAVAVAGNVLEAARSVPYGRNVPDEVRQPSRIAQVAEDQKTVTEFRVAALDFRPSNVDGRGADPGQPTCVVTVTVEWDEGTASASEKAVKRYTATTSLTR